MPSIQVDGATFSFISLRGEPEPVGMEVEVVTRPGVNGHAYWEDAKRGRPFDMEGYVDKGSFSDAASAFELMKAKQGKVGTVTDDRGRIFLNVAILGVERVSIRPVAGSVGGLLSAGSAAALLVVRFRMLSSK